MCGRQDDCRRRGHPGRALIPATKTAEAETKKNPPPDEKSVDAIQKLRQLKIATWHPLRAQHSRQLSQASGCISSIPDPKVLEAKIEETAVASTEQAEKQAEKPVEKPPTKLPFEVKRNRAPRRQPRRLWPVPRQPGTFKFKVSEGGSAPETRGMRPPGLNSSAENRPLRCKCRRVPKRFTGQLLGLHTKNGQGSLRTALEKRIAVPDVFASVLKQNILGLVDLAAGIVRAAAVGMEILHEAAMGVPDVIVRGPCLRPSTAKASSRDMVARIGLPGLICPLPRIAPGGIVAIEPCFKQ